MTQPEMLLVLVWVQNFVSIQLDMVVNTNML